MKQKNRFVLTFLMLTMQPVSVLQAQSISEDNVTLTEVIFAEMEPGIDPYKSRLLLNESFLRLDDGEDQGDFILFDRKSHEIHSFNHADRSHLVMKSLPPVKLEFTVDFKVEKKKLLDAPKVQGVVPQQHLYFADNQLCKTSFNAKGLLPELTQVLIDYEQAIVEQNKQTLSQIPASVRSSCYMANNYLHASYYLQDGFPLLVVDDQGRQKKLLSFDQVKKHPSIMQQPDGYSIYYPSLSNLD